MRFDLLYWFPEKRHCPAELSKAKGLPKFNGFCFSVNVDKISPAAYEPHIHLFDPADIIVGQEDHLVQRMHEKKLMPIILHCAFVFHFKSITVSVANFTVFRDKMRSYNITVKQKGKSPLATLEYRSKGQVFAKQIDIREDLRWYHPEEQQNFVHEIFNLTKSTKSSESLRAGLQCQPPSQHGRLFPLESPGVFSRLQRLYNDYSSLNWNIRTNAICVYPSQWPPYCQQLLSGGSTFEPDNYAVSTSSQIVIAFAISGTGLYTFLSV
jgi:hypothetical protein